MYLSIVIPAYNEAKRLPQTLQEIRPYLDRQRYAYEVLIIDDGSLDQTVSLCREAEKNWKQLP